MAGRADGDALTHSHVFLGRTHDENARRTLWVVALTAVMMVGEIVAGWVYGSMALLADGFTWPRTLVRSASPRQPTPTPGGTRLAPASPALPPPPPRRDGQRAINAASSCVSDVARR